MELENLLDIDINPFLDAKSHLNSELALATADYARIKAAAENDIQPLRSQIRSVYASIETPIDYVKSEIKKLPLAADSMSMEVQNFPRNTNTQDSRTYATAISKFVAGQTSFLGVHASTQMTTATQIQASEHAANHDLIGTLVFSVSCTHKNVAVHAPLVLNVDKGVKVWNSMFERDDKLDPTKTDNIRSAAKSAASPSTANKFSIILGVTYGSRFVGMVHVLNDTDTSVSQTLISSASSWQAQMDAGGWFESNSGGFRVSKSIGNEMKHLLSSQNVASHVTLISAGITPSLIANNVKLGIEMFAKFDPQASIETIATIQNATVADQTTIKAGADAARTWQQMVSLKAGEIKAALSALAEVDDGSNKILDVNSMMTALEDYIKRVSEGNVGVPINYYLKDITKDTLAQL